MIFTTTAAGDLGTGAALSIFVFVFPSLSLFNVLHKRGVLVPHLTGFGASQDAPLVFILVLGFLNMPYILVKAIIGMYLYNTKVLAIRTFYNWWLYWWLNTDSHAIDVAIDTDVLNESIYMEIIFETLPQIVIQLYNNFLFQPNISFKHF